ncbi:MAG: hypothetical protein AB7G80_01565 [Dongiaceae bacterium]
MKNNRFLGFSVFAAALVNGPALGNQTKILFHPQKGFAVIGKNAAQIELPVFETSKPKPIFTAPKPASATTSTSSQAARQMRAIDIGGIDAAYSRSDRRNRGMESEDYAYPDLSSVKETPGNEMTDTFKEIFVAYEAELPWRLQSDRVKNTPAMQIFNRPERDKALRVERVRIPVAMARSAVLGRI